MGMLDLAKGISSETHNRFTVIMGKPGSGKTTLAGTFPKPMLYVSVDTDGGGEVLKCYSDKDVQTLSLKSDEVDAKEPKHIQTKLMALLDELKEKHPYKTVVIDAYSSIEEGVIAFLEKNKKSRLSLQERGVVGTLMLNLRDKIVELSRGDVEYVAVCHIKDKKTTDNTTGEESTMIVPKMSYNNGNILLERASNVMYCSKRAVINEDNSRRVAFLTYIGAHPNMDTKFRTEGKSLETGLYLENLTYEKIESLRNNSKEIEKVDKIKVVEKQENPFEEEKVEEGEDW